MKGKPAHDPGLQRVWSSPAGWRYITEVNNTDVGLWYVAAGLLFFLLGGILALLIRLQLAFPGLNLLAAADYNAVFTMHGTVMMFLFAVPIMEGFAVYVMPQMLGSRDLPFPRLSAYGFWCYLFGGLLLYSSFLFSLAPAGGWFMYVPLTLKEFTPDRSADFWLLGVTFIEISALSAAIEIIIGILTFRAPGMGLNHIPLICWAFLTTAVMIVFAFPPILMGDVLLEVQRAFDIPYFDAARGGDPLLWQHLFWIFGHPEVYIIFLPAAGMVSTFLPSFCGRPLVGYRWVLLATVATGFISFGLWVHHMFATGIPQLSLSFFSTASMAVAIPSGIQMFAWLATLWGTRPRLEVPMLFILGFLVTFTLGGLTGVMVASVPFDWQVHDTYFVVAHFHYVLIGGAVFPVFAAFYYWFPLPTAKRLSERTGRWVFGLIFVGFHLTFGPMHLLGLWGMPRRIYTYPEGLGWEWLNLAASLGAALLGLGILLFLADLVITLRSRERAAGDDPWKAGTLEWVGGTPVNQAGIASVPTITSLYPLWDQPGLASEIRAGQHLIPRVYTGGRETMRVSPVHAVPQQLLQVPGPSWMPVLAAVTTAIFVVGGLVHSAWMIAAGAALTLPVLLRWAWTTDREPTPHQVEVGRGVRLPTYSAGSGSHAWWALVITLIIDFSAFATLVFSFFYLWMVQPGAWPPEGQAVTLVPGLRAGAAAMLLASSLLAGWGTRRVWRIPVGVPLAMAAALLALLLLVLDLLAGPLPTAHAYPGMVWTILIYGLGHLLIALLLGGYTLARQAVGLVSERRAMLPALLGLYWHAMTGRLLVGLAVVALFPRLV